MSTNKKENKFILCNPKTFKEDNVAIFGKWEGNCYIIEMFKYPIIINCKEIDPLTEEGIDIISKTCDSCDDHEFCCHNGESGIGQYNSGIGRFIITSKKAIFSCHQSYKK